MMSIYNLDQEAQRISAMSEHLLLQQFDNNLSNIAITMHGIHFLNIFGNPITNAGWKPSLTPTLSLSLRLTTVLQD
jgi:hypothetical protein